MSIVSNRVIVIYVAQYITRRVRPYFDNLYALLHRRGEDHELKTKYNYAEMRLDYFIQVFFLKVTILLFNFLFAVLTLNLI